MRTLLNPSDARKYAHIPSKFRPKTKGCFNSSESIIDKDTVRTWVTPLPTHPMGYPIHPLCVLGPAGGQ